MINNEWKRYTSKVVFTFKNGRVYEATGENKIIQIDINKNTSKSDSYSPFGIICSNTILIKLKDIEEVFVKTNTSSPYYGLIEQGFKIEYYIKVDNGEYERGGIYYCTDIENSSSSLRGDVINVEGADLLQYISNSPVNLKIIKKNITVKEYLAYIFESFGLTEGQYHIADTLNHNLKYGYSYGKQLKEILNDIARSYICNIYVDENGIIQVIDLKDLAKQTEKQFEFSGTLNVFETTLGIKMLSSYNAIKLNYVNPTDIENTKILSTSSLSILPGDSTLSEFTFGDEYRTLGIQSVSIKPEEDMEMSVNWFEASQDRITVNVNNPAEDFKKASVDVFGKTIVENKVTLDKNAINVDKDKRKYLEVETSLIQDDDYAKEYVSLLVNFIMAETNYITVRCRVNPILKLGSIVSMRSDRLKFNSTCILTGVKLSLGKTDTFQIELLNCSALAVG